MKRLIQKLPLKIVDTIIDIETTGFSPEKDKMVTFGIVEKDTLKIFQLESKDDPKRFLNKFRGYTKMVPGRLAAYYRKFEEDWLKREFEIELQPFPYAKKEEMLHFNPGVLNDPFVRGCNVPRAWEEGRIEDIMRHNQSCLFKELFIYLLKFYQLEKFEPEIYQFQDPVKTEILDINELEGDPIKFHVRESEGGF